MRRKIKQQWVVKIIVDEGVEVGVGDGVSTSNDNENDTLATRKVLHDISCKY